MKHLLLTAAVLVSIGLASCAEDRPGVSDRKDEKVAAADAKNPVVVMETSMGTIKIQLDDAHAPNTVKNFLAYADDKFYDGTVFHRVIEDFMIQGGGFEPGLKQKKTKDPIKNEAPNELTNKRGTIAMARTKNLHSATAQFFINVKDNDFLDNPRSPYCVFGKVTEGMDVVDKIRKVETGQAGGMGDVPRKDVVIKSIRREEKQ
ncbi:MAG TPA: peptidylprolyl isomerase [Gemmataceae bacterium]|jgi:cyclophilin family peptidyl-prolyl cis-trans isomerase